MTFNKQVSIFCNSCKCGNTKLKGIKDKDWICHKWIKTYEIICKKCGKNYIVPGSDNRAIEVWNKGNPGESSFKKEGIQIFKKE